MSALRITRPPDAARFLKLARTFLVRREAEHNLTLGLAVAIRDQPSAFDEPAYLAVVTDRGGSVVATALRTPPNNLIVSVAPDSAALDLIVVDVSESGQQLPGVLAPAGVAEAFARRWCERHRLTWEIALSERIYQLDRVLPPARPAPGGMRPAAAADVGMLVEWLAAFEREALPAPPSSRAELNDAVTRGVTGGGYRTLYVWEDGGPASLAGVAGATPNGIRIGPVYTPPERRGRGYAGSLVAAVSQAQLDAGRRFCFLYTDLANPTSNRIYQEVGYRPIADATQIRFSARA